MSVVTVDELEKASMELEPAERAVLLERLLESLSEPHPELQKNLERRSREVREGVVKGIGHSEVLARARENLQDLRNKL